jgi:hypothetical protein
MDKATLESLEAKGPEVVLREIAQGLHGSASDSRIRQDVEAWLRAKQLASDKEASYKRDSREEETLAVAKEALSIAKDANRIASEDLDAARESAASAQRQARWAMWAAIVATAAAIVAASVQLNELISWLQK